MKLFVISILTALSVLADDSQKPPPEPTTAVLTIKSLLAEMELLKAQIAEFQIGAKWDLVVCRQPDLMQARLATIAASEKAEAQKKIATKPVPHPDDPTSR